MIAAYLLLLLALPVHEETAIAEAVAENVRPELQADGVKLLRAIRRAENGGPGREWGIMNAKANTLRKQAGWCAATFQKNWDRWSATQQAVPFLVFFAGRYAPEGVANDPDQLNQFWLGNVIIFLEEQN